MFSLIDKSKGLLFVSRDLRDTISATNSALLGEISTMNGERFLNTAPEDLKRYLQERYSITPITLLPDQWYARQEETHVDVRYDQRRAVRDRSQAALVPGELTEVRIPFEGEAELFYTRADTYSMNPPRAIVDKNELVLRFEIPADQPMEIRPQVDHILAEIEQHLQWQRAMIDGHNASLPGTAAQAIQQRRDRLLAQSKRAEALGIPIRPRSDAPKTFAVPTTRRKAAPTLPPASTAQFKPEPIWLMEQYEQALKVMQDMALVMERSPEAFRTLDEEALRQHFLMQLNAQFEGKATGETFNMGGKTDILLREGDRNVFIAECKFWRGPKGFGEAVDQLLGYSTWRDSKSAILVFNRGTETSTVLAGIDAVIKGHKNYKRPVNWPHESGFRYVLHSPGDANREITLTVLVFHVPT